MTTPSDVRETLEKERQSLKEQLFYQEDYLRRLKSRGEMEKIGAIETEIENIKEQLAEVERRLRSLTSYTKSHTKDQQRSLDKSAIITLIIASFIFASLLFAVLATFKWAMGRNMEPLDFIILTPVAVILALVLYPFVLVLLRVFSPQMAQEQFNRLHDFAESSFPTLLHWLDRFSQAFKSGHTDQLSPGVTREAPSDQNKKATTSKTTRLNSRKTTLEDELAQHCSNLANLSRQRAIYAVGEEPLHLLNQIEAEEQAIAELEARLEELSDSD